MENKDRPFKDSLPEVTEEMIQEMNIVPDDFAKFHIEYLKSVILTEMHKILDDNESIIRDAIQKCECNRLKDPVGK